MRKNYRTAAKAFFGLFLILAAGGSVGIAHADLVILDHFDNNTYADSGIWLKSVNPLPLFTEPSGTYMVASSSGYHPEYSLDDRSYIVSQQAFGPGFRGGIGIAFNGLSFTDFLPYPDPDGASVGPSIGVGFTPAEGVNISIFRAPWSGAGGNWEDVFMFQYRNFGEGILERYFLSATGITSGVLWLQRAEDGIHGGYSEDLYGTGEIEFSKIFGYSEYSLFQGSTRMIVTATPGENGTFSANIDFAAYEAEPVPLPPSVLLLAPGLLGLAVMRRRNRR